MVSNNGGPAFPKALDPYPNLSGTPQDGMTLRDYFAAHAPVDYSMACQAFGSTPNLNNDQERAAFFAVWAFMRSEYADAMLKARQEGGVS